MDIYIKKVAKRYWLMSEYIQRLEKIKGIFSTEFIKIEGNSYFEEKEWWHYNYENFLIRLSALLDQTGKLIIEVYEFKIREKHSNWNSAMIAVKTKNKYCADKIDEFQKYLENYRLARHDIVHKGGYESEDINAIDEYLYDEFELQFFGDDQDVGNDWFNSMKDKKDEEKGKLRIKLGNIIDESISYIKEIFDIIENDFQSIIDSKKKT